MIGHQLLGNICSDLVELFSSVGALPQQHAPGVEQSKKHGVRRRNVEVMYGGLVVHFHARAGMLWQREHVRWPALVPHRVSSGIAFTMSRAEANGCAIIFWFVDDWRIFVDEGVF
jgi:hypothetical protein